MNIENTQSQMRKGVLEYCILSIIKRGEAYPGDIIEEMKDAGLLMLEGTLYPLLNRLRNVGVLTYRWVESPAGPPRKYFRLTDKGQLFYDMLGVTWNQLSSGVETLVKKTDYILQSKDLSTPPPPPESADVERRDYESGVQSDADEMSK